MSRHVDGLPFGMATHPDGPLPPQPLFGGPTDPPDRIIVTGQRADLYNEAEAKRYYDGLGDT